MTSLPKRLQIWAASITNRLSGNDSPDTSSTSNLVDCPNAAAHPTSSVSTDYTELMSGSVPCPSCGGSGRIPKELEETLVALIPMSDDRLKPKKTVLYVLVGIIVCAIIAAIFIYVFLPRTVILTSNSPPIEVVFISDRDNETHSRIEFNFANAVNVTNTNYFPVDIVNVSATVISKFQPWSMDVVGNGWNTSTMRISPFGGSSQRIWFNNTVALKGIVA
uniref:Transmembrane protein 106A n=1 Tax=Panagrellus redivivus TaxID=6233 RepID=A0A7E4UW73_PANRE